MEHLVEHRALRLWKCLPQALPQQVLAAAAERIFSLPVDVRKTPVGIQRDEPVADALQNLVLSGVTGPQGHRVDDDRCEGFERGPLASKHSDRGSVSMTHRDPRAYPSLGHQRRTGIEPNVRRPHHERVVCKPGVRGGVFNDHHLFAADVVAAERHLPGGLALLHPDARLKPLPLFVDESNQRNGDILGAAVQAG